MLLFLLLFQRHAEEAAVVSPVFQVEGGEGEAEALVGFIIIPGEYHDTVLVFNGAAIEGGDGRTRERVKRIG